MAMAMATAVGDVLVQNLHDQPHAFLQPPLPLYTDTVAYLKHALDPLAADVSAVQQQRLQDERKKRKRGDHVQNDALRLKQIHVDGFAPEQVWEQVRRVIAAAQQEAERGLVEAEARLADEQNKSELFSDDDDEDVGSEEDEDNLGEEGIDYIVEGEDSGEEEYNGSDSDDDVDDLTHDDFEEMGLGEDGDEDEPDEPAEEFVEDKFGLNDGFFSIDQFNLQSELLEQQDARGQDDDAASDEEDVDWDADPLAGAPTLSNGAGRVDEANEDDDDEEDGPTFGDPDAESEDDDDEAAALGDGELDGMNGLANTNEIMYAEFFAPPAQKKKKNKKGRPNPHNFPAETAKPDAAAEEEDVERTMAAVHRDLFDDEASMGEEEDDDDAEGAALDPADPRSRRSTHERRKAALAEEIRKLEAANVAKREWVLSGEARAADRPMNSLLEEDLDFERTGKPVPVITAEVTESLEELIKRRILAHDFQDIIRRRPDDLATGGGRRGRLDFELDDTKAKKGLAEEYEEEHLRRTDPNFVDAQDAKTKKEQDEITAMWNKIRSDLDSLSSWNFRPKAPAPQIEIRVDAPVVSMEDARPSAGGDVAGASQLAPQEIYRAGESSKGVKDEVVGKSGLPAGREEMSRDEKKRRRRRDKARIHKAQIHQGAAASEKSSSKSATERKNVVGELKKGGVKIIGKKGNMTDVEGKAVKNDQSGQTGAGRYKL